jgi:hypothetical protein
MCGDLDPRSPLGLIFVRLVGWWMLLARSTAADRAPDKPVPDQPTMRSLPDCARQPLNQYQPVA